MTSEIVTRLINYQEWLDANKSIDDFIADVKGDRSCERAADEITRLNELLANRDKLLAPTMFIANWLVAGLIGFIIGIIL